MKLVRVRLKNFRCYQEEVEIPINDLTVLIGKNDAGKSAVLDALSIFFGESDMESEDACVHGERDDVRIICEFEDFPDTLVLDAEYQTTLANEYLLNKDGRLEIHQVYDCTHQKPKHVATYAFAVHPSTANYNDLLLLKIADLKSRAEQVGIDTEAIDMRVSKLIRRAIWDSADDLGLASKEIHLSEATAKVIWDQLKNYLPSFSLFKSDRPSTDQDAEAQDPMKAAVKEAIGNRIDELDAIAEYIQQEVRNIANLTLEKLREMDPTLASQIKPIFTKPKWDNIFKIGLTDDEDIPMNKRGSGVRRLILLNFFRAKAEQVAESQDASSLIYAIEEPETSQHPHNQRMLISALSEISERADCQVILSTHTPTLARLVPSESLRYISVEEDGRVIRCGDDETYEIVAQSLGVLPDHDVKLFIGVEGQNDINFLKTVSRKLINQGEAVPNLEELEEKGEIIFFPLGGSNLAFWVSRVKELNVPEFYLFDRGVEPPAESVHQATVNEINERPGCKAVLTGKGEMENYLHPQAIKVAKPEVDITFGDFDDVPAMAARAVHENSESFVPWDDVSDEKKNKKMSSAKYWLNTIAAELMTAELLDEIDTDGDVRSWFAYIGEFLEG